MARTSKVNKQVESFTCGDASRKNIPTAEYQSVMERDDRNSLRIAYQRRKRDLDLRTSLAGHGRTRHLRPPRAGATVTLSRKKSTPRCWSTTWYAIARIRKHPLNSTSLPSSTGCRMTDARTEFYQARRHLGQSHDPR